MNHTLARILSLVMMILLFIIPTHAQDATQEATVEANPVSVVGEGTVINVNPSNPVETPSDSGPASSILQVVLAVCAIIVTISYALEKVGNRAKAAKTNPFETAALEKLGDGVPSVVVLQITGALDRVTTAFENITATWKEATDKTPAASKMPSPIPYAETLSGVPISVSQTATANLPKDLTDIHGEGGAGTGGQGGFQQR